jgi:hypothetical protein
MSKAIRVIPMKAHRSWRGSFMPPIVADQRGESAMLAKDKCANNQGLACRGFMGDNTTYGTPASNCRCVNSRSSHTPTQ